jgi:O-antigen chain-terminating methyltransferase
VVDLHRDVQRISDHLPLADRRLDRVEEQLAAVDRRFDSGDEVFEAIRQRIGENARRLDEIAASVTGVQSRFDGVEDQSRRIQGELESLGDERIPAIERRLDNTERIADSAEAEAARLREVVVPAVVDRGNVLIDRLAAELEEVASLVQRMLLAEPLPVPSSGPERRMAEELALVQPRILDAFRGSEGEIRHRLEHHLAVLEGVESVLDLGCGRGELLLLLREAGVEASGVESDPALAQAARRRGLGIIENDVFEALRSQDDGRWGAITAIHFLEHFVVADVLSLLDQFRRVLQPGGVLLVECPNPHNLRVGAALFWRDPTHLRPLLPETLALYLEASGFEVGDVSFLHPFPSEERFGEDGLRSGAELGNGLAPIVDRIERMAGRLDELLTGPRDFAIVARKPTG